MVNALKRLSIWEIGHRWHGVDPEQTDPKLLPLPVRDALRSLTRAIHYDDVHALNDQGIENHTVHNRSTNQGYSPERIHDKLAECYEGGVFDKQFLEAVFIEKEDIGKWCQQNKIALPDFWFSDGWKPPIFDGEAKENMKDEQGQPSPQDTATALRPVQIDKLICQAVAKTLWEIYPKMTIADMCKNGCVQRYGQGKLYPGVHTLRNWLSEVAPTQVKGKPGRPKKKSSERLIEDGEK